MRLNVGITIFMAFMTLPLAAQAGHSCLVTTIPQEPLVVTGTLNKSTDCNHPPRPQQLELCKQAARQLNNQCNIDCAAFNNVDRNSGAEGRFSCSQDVEESRLDVSMECSSSLFQTTLTCTANITCVCNGK